MPRGVYKRNAKTLAHIRKLCNARIGVKRPDLSGKKNPNWGGRYNKRRTAERLEELNQERIEKEQRRVIREEKRAIRAEELLNRTIKRRGKRKLKIKPKEIYVETKEQYQFKSSVYVNLFKNAHRDRYE